MVLGWLKNVKKVLNKDVFLYQMGKVGSNTISHSLELMGYEVGSKHYFGGDIQHLLNLQRSRWKSKLAKILVRIYLSLKQKPTRIITLVRDPVARNLSLNFFLLEHILYHTLKDNELKGSYPTIDEVISIGFEKYLNHEGPLKWFTEEFEMVTGIDVYDYPFDKEKGFSIIEKGKTRLLLLKLEKLNTHEHLIGEFLGMKNFRLKTANVGNKNWYSSFYDSFKQNPQLPEGYLDKLYKSRFMKHFYTSVEIEKFRITWNQ